ncbi:MAG: single-stranded-DNA-specific exonuclease RecJ [Nitrospirae bacterium]|nr:single-stranded-DNA-specific exonuclease RecJ [Nitrospirota bacterium]
MKKRWIIGEGDSALQEQLCAAINITPLVSRILINRGIRDITSARDFLQVSYRNLIDPFLLNDMEKAVSRITDVIRNKGRIMICGDYDVDGVTASALYIEFFKKYGVDGTLYIPDRMREGYGLNEAAVLMARSQGIDVILTADCGTTSTAPVRLAQSLGIDVIVTDHHEPPKELPDAFAMINPNRHDSTYPFKGLAGVGVAFKLVQALSQMLEARSQRLEVRSQKSEARINLTSDFWPLTSSNDDLSSCLDLVALGTIADVAPITGENRFFVKEGLRLLTEGKRVGIAALKDAAGMRGGDVTAGAVGFILAPRINASGRLSKADMAVRLLTTKDPEEARHIASYLNQMNEERQRIEAKIKNEVREKIAKEMDINREKVIVMASGEWHQGVIGIVASKIVDEFYRPCILISLQEDGNGKGSARSIPGFNIYEGLEECSDLIEKFGGHKYAAGLTIKGANIPLLRERLSVVAGDRLSEEDFIPRLIMDAEIDLEEISFPLLKEMTLLPPYGVANPEPVIVSRGLRVMEPKLVGKDHLKIKLRRGGTYLDCIGFNMASAYNNIIKTGGEIDAAYTPELNLWNGTYGIQLKLKDMRVSDG